MAIVSNTISIMKGIAYFFINNTSEKYMEVYQKNLSL